MKIKLYNAPRNTKIYCTCSDGSNYLIFKHIDGMFSFCETEKGGIIHLGATSELEPFEDGYKLVEDKEN